MAGPLMDWERLRARTQRIDVNGQISQWREVKSGPDICPGSVLFSLFINDPESEMSSKVAKFVDNTQHFCVVKTRRDCEEPQKDV